MRVTPVVHQLALPGHAKMKCPVHLVSSAGRCRTPDHPPNCQALAENCTSPQQPSPEQPPGMADPSGLAFLEKVELRGEGDLEMMRALLLEALAEVRRADSRGTAGRQLPGQPPTRLSRRPMRCRCAAGGPGRGGGARRRGEAPPPAACRMPVCFGSSGTDMHVCQHVHYTVAFSRTMLHFHASGGLPSARH